jgi:hypothetical protein
MLAMASDTGSKARKLPSLRRVNSSFGIEVSRNKDGFGAFYFRTGGNRVAE